MALQKEFTDIYDIRHPNCYWKIPVKYGIYGGKNKLVCRILCYPSKIIADSDSGEIGSRVFSFKPDLDSGKNFITQGYDVIRNTPEFGRAINV